MQKDIYTAKEGSICVACSYTHECPTLTFPVLLRLPKSLYSFCLKPLLPVFTATTQRRDKVKAQILQETAIYFGESHFTKLLIFDWKVDFGHTTSFGMDVSS